MRVRATKMGYYGIERRREGAEFEIADQSGFSKDWMVLVNAEDVPRVQSPAPEMAEDVMPSGVDPAVEEFPSRRRRKKSE